MQKEKKYIVIAVIAIGILSIVLAGILFSNKPLDGESVDVVLCLDDSKDMFVIQKERNQAARKLLKQLGSNVNIGALYYQNNVTSAANLRTLSEKRNVEELDVFFESALHDEPNANSNMAGAIYEAIDMIKQFQSDSGSVNDGVIFLFTDGTNNYFNENGEKLVFDVEKADGQTKKAIKRAWEENIQILTVCYNDEWPVLIKDLMDSTGVAVIKENRPDKLDEAFLSMMYPYTKKSQKGKTGMELFILILIIGTGCLTGYYYHNYKKKEYILDYEVNMMEDEKLQKEKKAELDAHIRKEQQNKKFYLDIILTHGNAVGAKSCFDNEGRRRTGIINFGDITMIGKNSRGEDYFYRIDEAGMELWATFEENELLLKSQQMPFEIRTEGTPRDQGARTQKAVIKANQQYYIILGSKHEIGLLAQKN